jgi:hypothetical protein
LRAFRPRRCRSWRPALPGLDRWIVPPASPYWPSPAHDDLDDDHRRTDGCTYSTHCVSACRVRTVAGVRLMDGAYECTLCGAILDIPEALTAVAEIAEQRNCHSDAIVLDGVEIHRCDFGSDAT